MFENVRVILIETSHPGNIGSTARAMKTMGFGDLVLVNPRKFPHPEAYALASNANDILDSATTVDTLDEALSGCHVVIGASARKRTLAIPTLEMKPFAEKAYQQSQGQKVALLFGREHAGLTNDELYRCHYHVVIPTNPECSSLNLAQAVQILCYELRQYWLQVHSEEVVPAPEEACATVDETEGFYRHFESTLMTIDFMDRTHPTKLMSKVRRMFNRTMLTQEEVNIMRGILTALDKYSSGGDAYEK